MAKRNKNKRKQVYALFDPAPAINKAKRKPQVHKVIYHTSPKEKMNKTEEIAKEIFGGAYWSVTDVETK